MSLQSSRIKLQGLLNHFQRLALHAVTKIDIGFRQVIHFRFPGRFLSGRLPVVVPGIHLPIGAHLRIGSPIGIGQAHRRRRPCLLLCLMPRCWRCGRDGRNRFMRASCFMEGGCRNRLWPGRRQLAESPARPLPTQQHKQSKQHDKDHGCNTRQNPLQHHLIPFPLLLHRSQLHLQLLQLQLH